MSDRETNTSGSRGFLYRFFRKVRYLNYRGTLLQKTPRFIRRKKQLKRRRRWRHVFLFLRPVTYSRFRRIDNIKSDKIRSGPFGYESFSGHKKEAPVPKFPRKKLSFYERYHRFVRVTRYLRNKRRLYKSQQKTTRKRSFGRVIRILFYLIRTGKLFKIDYVAIKLFINRNYSFLGKAKFIIILFNSTAIYLIAYLTINIIKGFSTVFAANSYQVDTIFMYYDVNFLIRSQDWNPDMVQVVFSAAPFMSLFLSLISLVIYANTTYENWPVRLFFFWIMCHSYVQFFGELMIGSLLSKGFGWTIAYLFLLDTPKMVISLTGFLFLISAGLLLTRYMLYSGNIYFNKLDKNNRMPFVMSQFFLPYLLGTAILIGLKQPRMTQLEFSVAISMILLLFPAIVKARFSGNMYFDEEPKSIKIFWFWILGSLILITAFRMVLGHGIRI